MKNLLWILPVIFLAIILRLVELDKKKANFVVTADTNVSQVKGLSKYVTQQEVDSFAFRHWNIDIDKVMNNDKMENLRLLLKSKNTQEILNFMSDNNISVDEPLHYGVTPLMYASFYDDMDTAKELLNLGADPHKKDRYKLSPMAYAIGANSINAVKLLFENGVKFEEVEVVQGYIIPKWYGGITKIYVDENHNVVDVKILEKPEVDYIFKKGAWGTAFDVVVKSNMLEMTRLMLDSGYKPPKYHFADIADPDIRSGNTVEEIFTQDELNLMIDNEKKSGKFSSGQKKFDLDLFYDELKFYSLSPYSNFRDLYGYEEMLNLLLDYNISGQPSQKVMREVYEDCFYNFKRAIVRKANYIIDMKTGTDLKKEQEIFDKYKDEYAKKIRKTEHVSPYSEVPIWMIMNALEKDGLIIRTPVEIKPELIKFFDIAIDNYGKYCGDKDLDFDKLIYLDDKIIKDKTQYHAAFKYSNKQLDENENFKDVKNFIEYLTYKDTFSYPKYIKNTEQIYEKYIIDVLNSIVVSDTERNIFLKNGGKSLY